MPADFASSPRTRIARSAGALYALVIATGLWAEFAVRGRLIHAGDPESTWQAVTGNLGLFRASLGADVVMILADIGLAVLFYMLLRPVQRDLALAAMVLRLMQAALIGASLLAASGGLLLARDASAPEALAFLLDLHGLGYDLGLIFFGANTLITAWLFARSGLVPVWLPPLLGAAGVVYLAGSFSRLLAPELNALMQPAYAVPMLAETALCLLLLAGLRRPAAYA